MNSPGTKRTHGVVGVFLAFALLWSTVSQAARDWAYWETNDPASTTSPDHGDWNDFLVKYVYPRDDGINRLAYGNVLFYDRIALDKYVVAMAAVTVTGLNRDEQMVFWFNLYNALTVQLVLDAYPVATIRDIDISPGLFANGPWGKVLVEVEGRPLSLDDIEHKILRPIWQDPRIHYAVNCAALGCPDIGVGAFIAEELEYYLDYSASAYINHPRAVQKKSGTLILSSLYRWYADDFGGSDDAIMRHLAAYADPPLAELLSKGLPIGGYEYDWGLNDVSPSISDRLHKRGS